MASLLLVIIYIAFISLGLPDAMLGAGWPVMQAEFMVPYSFAGMVSMVISGGTIVSSVFSSRLLRRFGVGRVTAASVALTAAALLGFSQVPSFWWLLPLAVPLGIGAGAVDAGLNSFVAGHYESRHMSWLHSFWGVGALSGPLVLSALLARGTSWRLAYLGIALFQMGLVLVLTLAVRLWGRVAATSSGGGEAAEAPHQGLFFPLRLRGAKPALLAFLCYCGIESTMGLWGGSFLFKVKGIDAAAAATWVALFYASITLGRFLSGFITFKVSNKDLIRYGSLLILAGAAMMLLPLPLTVTLGGFLLVGLGCAPIFPCMLHETPERFGAEHAQSIMGFQMAVAYIGSTFLPPTFGFLASTRGMGFLPVFVFVYIAGLVWGSEVVRRKVGRG
ncbi:MAG: MFS transporter [Spirochaetota bacterium]